MIARLPKKDQAQRLAISSSQLALPKTGSRPTLSEIITCDDGHIWVAKSVACDPYLAQLVLENYGFIALGDLAYTQARLAFLAPAQETDPYWWEARECNKKDPNSEPYWCLEMF